MRTRSLLDAFFPRTRQALLALLLREPDRSWYLTDIARRLHTRPSSLQRELASLTDVGMLTREVDGGRVYYRVSPTFPLLPELRQIFIKTAGLAEPIAATLRPFWDDIRFAFLYGSVARGERSGGSDIDLMLIGDLSLTALAPPLRALEERLGAEVNVSLYTPAEYRTKWQEGSHFVRTVQQGEKIFLKGTEHELAVFAGEPEDQGAPDEQAGARRPAGGHRS